MPPVQTRKNGPRLAPYDMVFALVPVQFATNLSVELLPLGANHKVHVTQRLQEC
jgi:hypothetical protein